LTIIDTLFDQRLAMRRWTLIAFAVVIVVAASWFVGRAQAQPRVSEFNITVQLSNGGLVAQCSLGCVWKDITFSCGDPRQPCRAEIDQFGVGVGR
jgi:hypothetical protein